MQTLHAPSFKYTHITAKIRPKGAYSVIRIDAQEFERRVFSLIE